MTDGLRVTIAGLDFYGQGLHDFVISPDGFAGWDDGVDMRLENTGRPQAHGSFDLPGFMDARTVAVSGNVFADSPQRLAQLRARLTGVLAGGQSGRVQVERFGDVQWADGRLASKTMFTERGGQNTASFQIQLWCPDPRKFGELHSWTIAAGATVDVSHRGNIDATPKFTVAGSSAGGYTLNVAGRSYIVQIPLVTGQPHVIDYNDGRLRIGGVIIHGAASQSTLWKVPPGDQTAVTFTTVGGGTGTATLELLDTYI